MTTTTAAAPEEEPDPVTVPEHVEFRERMYQRWLASRSYDAHPVRNAPDQLAIALAFTEGFMSCWAEFRDVILAAAAAAGDE